MDSKSAGRKANPKQYRAVNGKWQFVPLVKSCHIRKVSVRRSMEMSPWSGPEGRLQNSLLESDVYEGLVVEIIDLEGIYS